MACSFEIIAKREIAEHLEKSMVPRRIANIFKVIMLAARPQRFLRRGRAGNGTFFHTGKDVFELHHPRIGKKQTGVIAWHQRTGRYNFMPIFGEIIEEEGTNITDAVHFILDMVMRQLPVLSRNEVTASDAAAISGQRAALIQTFLKQLTTD